MDAAEVVHDKFVAALTARQLPGPAGPASDEVPAHTLVALFRSQCASRQLDRIARRLQARGEGFYTIGSSGHEGNAAVAEALRVDDIAFLHYRSAAFQLHRAGKVPGQTPGWDMLLSFAASAEDPISGGRHKVLGSRALNIPPQTSTIASHLPKAVGAAFGIALARTLRLEGTPLPHDGIVLASFGDASANHSTAQGAFNTAGWAAHQGSPMPIVFLCEDNGIGISTPTPEGWIASAFGGRAGLSYMACDGADPVDVLLTARRAADHARRLRRPVFLHMRCVRLYGHAGSDMQAAYRRREEIEEEEARDPLLGSAGRLVAHGAASCDDLLAIYHETGARLTRMAEAAITRPKLTTAVEVMASIVPPKRMARPVRAVAPADRDALFARDAALIGKPQHMARLLSWALADLMLAHPELIVAGEDVGPKGGVYNVTARLHERFGPARVINTLLDEQAILGLAIGVAHNDLVAIPEIQFLAYVHNAEDQLRGEAATLPFFSDGQYANPMVVRIAGLPYQKGFGGHFHNDNSLAVFRDIPGLIIAVPGNGRDAVAMLRESVRLAREEGRVVIFVEPIALYMTRDLHEPGDGLMTAHYEAPGEGAHIALGELGVTGEGGDLAIVSYANGHMLSLQAARMLAGEGVAVRTIDLRWLAPIDPAALMAAVGDARRILIVDECRVTGSPSEGLIALFAEHAPDRIVARIAAEDCFIPLGRAATVTLPDVAAILARARLLLEHAA